MFQDSQQCYIAQMLISLMKLSEIKMILSRKYPVGGRCFCERGPRCVFDDVHHGIHITHHLNK